MTTPASTTPHEDTQTTVLVLKSNHYGRQRAAYGQLPYAIDLIEQAGVTMTWSDDHMDGPLSRGPLGSLVRRSEALLAPWAQVWTSRRLRRDADAVLAIFESEGHGLAAWRHLPTRRQGPPLVIMACWLADLARSASPARRRLYRWLYRRVDGVIVFSSNQVATLTELVGIPAERIHVVRFGVPLEELETLAVDEPTPDGTTPPKVVAAGRDLGRDWATLAAAARGTGWRVDLITRPSQVDGIDLPAEVELAGVLDRAGYLDRLAGAAVVVLPTEIREYPTGQTVLLEAMALGRACVVTDTPAMREYVRDGETAVLVPPHDPVALRTAVDALLADDDRCRRLGGAARAAVVADGGAAEMWRQVADVVRAVRDRA